MLALRSLLSVVLAALAAVLLAVPAAAQEPLRATATLPVGDAPAHGAVTSTALADGYLAAWGVRGGVRVRPLDAAGAPAGPARSVSIGSAENIRATELLLVADPAGDADLVSVEYDEWAWSTQVKLRRVDASGSVVGSPVTLLSGRIHGADAVRTADGGLLVTSVDWQASPRSVVARRVRPDRTLEAVKRVVPATGSDETVPRTALAPDPAGGALLVFNSASSILALRLDASATPLGAAVELGSGRWPDVASSGTEYLAVWDERDETFTPGAVVARRLDLAGQPAAPAFDVSARAAIRDADYGPVVVADRAGGAWITARRAGNTIEHPLTVLQLLARRLPFADPAASAPEVPLDDPAFAPGVPALATGAGGTLVTWRPTGVDSVAVARRVGAGPDPGTAAFESAPAGVLDSRSAQARARSTRLGATFECRLDEGVWAACASPLTLSGLGDRVHTLAVRSVGPEGWVELGAGAQARWRTEAAPPDTRITEPPKLNEHWTRIGFEADEAALFDCRLDGGAWAPCADFGAEPSLKGGFAKAGLPEGPHVFEARARDESGRVEVEPARWAFTLDRRAPTTRVTRGPAPRSSATPVFEFSADELDVTYECRRGDSTSPDEWKPCASGQPVTWVTRMIEVRATDAAGNVGSGDKFEWGLDPYAEGYGQTSSPADSAQYRITPRAGSVAECTRDGARWWRCPALVNLYDVRPGEQHPLRVRGVGADGTIGDGYFSYNPGVPGPTVPWATIVGAPPSITTSRSARIAWTVSGPAGSFVCTVDGGAEQPCTSPLRLDGLAPGEHTVLISGRVAGVPSSPWEGARVSWQIVERGAAKARAASAVPPDAPELWGGPGPRDSSGSFAWDWYGSQGVVGSECSLDGAPFTPCAPGHTVSGLSDGPHTFAVRVFNAAGERSSAATSSWTTDLYTPVVTVPPLRQWIASRDVEVTFSADRDGSTFECSVDDGAWAPCSSPLRLTGLDEGPHGVVVRATNRGRVSEPRAVSFGVDVTVPDTRVTSPMLVAGMRTSLPFARFRVEIRDLGRPDGHAWREDGSGVSALCILDGVELRSCDADEGITRFDGLVDGTHVLEVVAIDQAGNRDPSPAVFSWVVGAEPVETRIESGPAAATDSRDAAFVFAGAGADGFECRLDGGAWEACRADARFTDLADGTHRLEVRAHRWGRSDATPAGWDWTVDAAPRITIATGPEARSGDDRPAFTLLVDDLAARRECRLDGGAWVPCPSSVSVGNGAHVFEARAIDAGGKVGEAEPWRWTTDLSAPDTTVRDAPAAASPLGQLLLGVSGSSTAERFECRLDAGRWEPCGPFWYISRLRPGEHVAVIRAVNASGTADPTPVVLRWSVDLEAPTLTVTRRTPERTKQDRAQVDITTDDPAAKLECRVDTRAWQPCASGWTPTGLPLGEHTATVRVTDAAGNARHGSVYWVQVEDTPEETEIISGPHTNGNNVRFVVGATGSIKCRLDGRPWQDCAGGSIWCCTPMPAGTHTVEFASTGPDGDMDPTPATHIWTIEGPAPTPSPSPSPSPEPTASPSPEPTASPSPEPTASPSPEPTASPSPEPTADPSPEPTASPSPEPTADPSPEPTADPSPEPTADPSPEPTALPGPFVVPRPFEPDVTPRKAAPVRTWARSVSVAARKAKAGRQARVRLSAPEAGRLVVRVLDRKGRTLARGSATFRRAGQRTFTLTRVRRGARATVSVRWTPASGRAQTATRRF